MVSINVGVCVVTPWCQEGVDLRDVIEHDDKKFVKLAKSNRRIERLLTGEGVGHDRLLTRTTIIQTLTTLRNERREEFIRASVSTDVEDLGLNEPQSKRFKSSASVVPVYADIQAPAVGPVAGRAITVVLSMPHIALWVEITKQSVEYLHDVVSEQLVHPGSDVLSPQLEPATGLPKNVVFCKGRNAYRVRYTENGNKRTKDFKIGDRSMDEFIAMVTEFLQQ